LSSPDGISSYFLYGTAGRNMAIVRINRGGVFVR
jgi:hypothetical protein